MPESGWFIDDVELPIGPKSDVRDIARTFQSETLFNFFPNLTKSSARSFDYTVVGFIYPEWKAIALDEIARSADTNIVKIIVPDSEKIFSGKSSYAVKKLTMSRNGPLFVDYDDGVNPVRVVPALPFTLTLTELPDEGEFQEGLDGFTDADEGALGTTNVNELLELTGSNLPVEDFGPIGLYQTLLGTIAI